MEGIRVNEFVFSGTKEGCSVSQMSLSKLMQKVGGHQTPSGWQKATCHGFRATLMDWGSELTAHSHETLEFTLAHSIPDKTRSAYRRYRSLEKRRALLNDWARYLSGESGANVVALRSVA